MQADVRPFGLNPNTSARIAIEGPPKPGKFN